MRKFHVGLVALTFGTAVVPVSAQQFLGRLGGGCVSLPSNHQQVIPLAIGAPAGASLIVTIATSSSFVSGLQIDDPAGSNYQALGGERSGAVGAVVHFRAGLQRSLAAGEDLVLTYENAGDTTQSCASVLGYAGIPFGAIVQDALGAASGNSSTATVAANTTSPAGAKLVLGGFATHVLPTGITAQAPASTLPVLCSSTGSLCLIDAQYLDNTAASGNIELTFDTAVDWAGALTVLDADGIFGNGFD